MALFKNPKEAQTAGISIVHQELNLMNHLTAAQNIFIGRESKGFFLNDKEINDETQKLFDQLRLTIKPTDKVGKLTVGKQQMVEISKAISYDSSVLILDEPTAALFPRAARPYPPAWKIRLRRRRCGLSMIALRGRTPDRS